MSHIQPYTLCFAAKCFFDCPFHNKNRINMNKNRTTMKWNWSKLYNINRKGKNNFNPFFGCSICTSHERYYCFPSQVHRFTLWLDLLHRLLKQIIQTWNSTCSRAPWSGYLQNGTVAPLWTPTPAAGQWCYRCSGLLQSCNEHYSFLNYYYYFLNICLYIYIYIIRTTYI